MSARLYLCCETGTPTEAVALVRGADVLAARAETRARGHGTTLLVTIEALLAEAGCDTRDLDALICGVGPGSFTGLRVSLATFKGLALALGRPLHGVRSIEAWRRARPDAAVISVVDARRGEIFADGFGLSAPVCCRPEALGALLGSPAGARPTLLGPGAVMHREALAAALPGAHIPADDDPDHRIQAGLLARAVDAAFTPGAAPPPDFAALEPCYVRPSDAEINYPDGFPDATMAPKQKLPPKAHLRGGSGGQGPR